jgi:hypothetical protein
MPAAVLSALQTQSGDNTQAELLDYLFPATDLEPSEAGALCSGNEEMYKVPVARGTRKPAITLKHFQTYHGAPQLESHFQEVRAYLSRSQDFLPNTDVHSGIASVHSMWRKRHLRHHVCTACGC